MSAPPSGFAYRRRKDGTIVITHHDREALTIAAAAAPELLDELADLDEDEVQHHLARLTGNYRRGNERLARSHPRNR